MGDKSHPRHGKQGTVGGWDRAKTGGMRRFLRTLLPAAVAALALAHVQNVALLAVAQQLRERSPELPIVCASIMPRGPEASSLAPVAYLRKPYALADLERVLTDALA